MKLRIRRGHRSVRSYRALKRNWVEKLETVNLPGVRFESKWHPGTKVIRRRDGPSATEHHQKDDNAPALANENPTGLSPPETKDVGLDNKTSALETTKTVELSETKRLSCYLVDQIAATLAILACRGRPSNYWHAVVLACLAKLSTKLKVLLGNLSDNIQICFVNSRNIYPIHYTSTDVDSNFGQDEREEDSLDANSPIRIRYETESKNVSSWLKESFLHALRGLGAEKPGWNKSDHLDVCAMIYAAGVSGTRTLICQDRRGEISGSSASLPVSFSSKALGLVGELGVLLDQGSGTSTPSNVTLEVELEELDGEGINPDVKSLGIYTISDFVVVAAALSLSHPSIGTRFQDSLNVISALPVFADTGIIDDNDDNPIKDVPSATKHTKTCCTLLLLWAPGRQET